MPEQPFPGVTGFFTSDEVPLSERQDGRWLNGFTSRAAFARVQAGYACGNCLAKFEMYMAVCPICKMARDVAADLRPDPDNWNAYWGDHLNGTGDGKGGATQTRTADEAIAAIFADPDIEQVPLKKLAPPKFGRGRPK